MRGTTRRFTAPDDAKHFPKGAEAIIGLTDKPVGLATFEPGWRWSNDMRPIVGTERCPFLHVGYALSGHLHVELPDGGALEVRAGDLFVIPPGHDAWVVGDETCSILDWGGKAREYAEAAAGGAEARR